MKIYAIIVAVMVAGGAAWGQTSSAPVTPAAGEAAGPMTAVPEVLDLLKMLRDRKNTLKDFTADIDYDVMDMRIKTSSGKRGKLSYLMDPAKGPIFSADFDFATENGKLTRQYFVQFIFDGKELTIKDMGLNGKGRTYVRTNLLPPGAKPGDAVTLNGALPLPIGLDVNEVLQAFEVTLLPSSDANVGVLKLVPRDKKKFDYERLDVTVDKKLELPVKVVLALPDDTETTIKLTKIEVNGGKAKMLDAATPASEGWVPKGE
jgi:hypothetical protein